MSSDLGLICFRDGDHSALPSDVLLQVLKPFVRPVIDERFSDELWELVFPDGPSGDLSPITEGDNSFDICIMHARGRDLFDAIYEIMRQTHTLMWWSGSDFMITADPLIVEHLPADYIEKYGTPPLVHSGADILAEIAKT